MTKELPLAFLTLPSGSGVARKFRFFLYSSRAMAQALLRLRAEEDVFQAGEAFFLAAGFLAAGFLAAGLRAGFGAGSGEASSWPASTRSSIIFMRSRR